MSRTIALSKDGKTATISIPLAFKVHSSRKRIIIPDGAPAWSEPAARTQNAMVKALARAWRWRKMVESGKYNTLAELAAEDRVNCSYLCRLIRLTLLSPNIVEAVLDGRQCQSLELQDLLRPLPSNWNKQEFLARAPHRHK
jgi:hypothetical protein